LQKFSQKKVLIAPLDWGLGHTTRCIPIIAMLLKQNYKVLIAANGIRKEIVLQEFPQVECITMPDYNINYGKNKAQTIIKLFGQINKIQKSIKEEQKWLQEITKQYSIDIIISDNRYGLYHPTIPCTFITHQLKPKSIFLGFGESFLQKKLYTYINKFTECWVMDEAGENNLAGTLSHPSKLPTIPTKYIGVTTRLKKEQKAIKHKATIILSGPEPQRTIVENKIVKQLQTCNEKIVLIRGVQNANEIPMHNKNIIVHQLLSVTHLNEIINESEFIICRSGYTSVMDLLLLQKKCIFIPTPAQTEQEYLANYLQQKNYALYFTQDKFNIELALQKASAFDYKKFVPSQSNPLEKAIQALLQS
jgi:uncharacterized protein (TIGR00661 family)